MDGESNLKIAFSLMTIQAKARIRFENAESSISNSETTFVASKVIL